MLPPPRRITCRCQGRPRSFTKSNLQNRHSNIQVVRDHRCVAVGAIPYTDPVDCALRAPQPTAGMIGCAWCSNTDQQAGGMPRGNESNDCVRGSQPAGSTSQPTLPKRLWTMNRNAVELSVNDVYRSGAVVHGHCAHARAPIVSSCAPFLPPALALLCTWGAWGCVSPSAKEQPATRRAAIHADDACTTGFILGAHQGRHR